MGRVGEKSREARLKWFEHNNMLAYIYHICYGLRRKYVGISGGECYREKDAEDGAARECLNGGL